MIKRVYFPGEKWVYFKIYTGVKSADRILIQSLTPLSNYLLKHSFIEKFFFIRYMDPDFHIRYRVCVSDVLNIGVVITSFYKYIQRNGNIVFVHDVELSTYHREIERYQSRFMELSEDLFFISSRCTMELLREMQGKNENIRWLMACRLIDAFLTGLAYRDDRKLEILEHMSASYKAEFGFHVHNSKQLNKIYRENRKWITAVMNDIVSLPWNMDSFLLIADGFQREISELTKDVELPLQNIYSYIHMSMNRLFRSQNRLCELLIYDFMRRYYKSEIAKRENG